MLLINKIKLKGKGNSYVGKIKVVENRQSFSGVLYEIYKMIVLIPYLRKYMRSIEKRYEIIFSEASKEAEISATKQLLKIIAVSVAGICIIFGLKPTIFTFLSSILIIYILSTEIVSRESSKMEILFLKELDSFLENIKHYYYQKNQITEAMENAANITGGIIRGHCNKLLQCISSMDREQAISRYMSCNYHKYLKLLLSLAVLVEENGDINDSEGSVFLNSLMQLRTEVLDDIRYITERRHKFSGLGYTAGIPIVSVPYIAAWGADTIPSLNGFYYGYTGLLIKGALLCLTYISYSMVVRLREGDRLIRHNHEIAARLSKIPVFSRLIDVLYKANYSKSMKITELLRRLGEKMTTRVFYMVKLLYLFWGLIISITLCELGHYESRLQIISDTGDISNISMQADGKQISAMERVIPEYTQYYIGLNQEPDSAQLEQVMLNEKGIRTKEVAVAAVGEITRRVTDYKKEYFNIKDFILAIIVAYLCYLYPSAVISFRRALSDNKMQDEVMQFQSLIHMLKRVPGISAVDVLEKMEDFAEIFRPSLQQCINEYNISDNDALERIYSKEKYAGFRKIIDCFMMVDEMGVEDAFDEISSEITSFKENRKLERRILLENEGLLGALIAIMPGGLIIFGYLLCPFLIRSVQIFSAYQSQLQQLSI